MDFSLLVCPLLMVLSCSQAHIPYTKVTLYHENHFSVAYEWSHLNFTWPTQESYKKALKSGYYIPQNSDPTGMKIYKNKMYLSMPKYRKEGGVPVTLAYISMDTASMKNELLTPFPSWEMNDEKSCKNLQSVQSMEIDTRGVMWVLDGVRTMNNVDCPAKLVFLDLNRNGLVIHTYIFPNEICLQNGGVLNDIVVDESDGGFAYITDSSKIDPGLIVYSRKKNRSWKVRDFTMFPDPAANNFYVDDVRITKLTPIDGIALSPQPRDKSLNRTLFYTCVTGYDLFAISTGVLKDEQLCRTDAGRTHVRWVGEKQAQTDGMVVDSKGNLFYTLVPIYGVGKWDTSEHFSSAEIIDLNPDEMIWTDGFAMDQKGYLYLMCNAIFNYIDPTTVLTLTDDIKFRIFKLYTGTRSYFFNDD